MFVSKHLTRGVLAAALVTAAAGAGANPGQFMAKLYTEALGRAPDAGGWQGGLNHFKANGCNRASLTTAALGVYTSAEYDARGYDNYEKVLAFINEIKKRSSKKSRCVLNNIDNS